MPYDTARRCYLHTICIATICLLTFLYTTKILNVTTIQRLNNMCKSKIKITDWLERIMNKQEKTNLALAEVSKNERTLELYKRFGSWEKLRDVYGLEPFNSDSKLVTGKEQNNRAKVEELKNQMRTTVIKSENESMDKFSEELTNEDSKRSEIGETSINDLNDDATNVNPLLSNENGIVGAMTTSKLQSTPLRYRKYGGEWLMTKDELLFLRSWCIERDYRFNWGRILEPCKYNTKWSRRDPSWISSNITTAVSSYVFDVELRPAGQYSRFYIQSVSQGGNNRSSGGDSWRVHIRGASSVSVTVVDNNNGIYEVFFLIVEPGRYSAEIVLDYTLCDGMKDPPDYWFTKGNSQGKYQHPDALPESKRPYLLEELHGGFDFTVKSEDISIFEEMNENGLLEKYCPNPSCLLWDGFGGWIRNVWKPYITEKKDKEPLDRRDGTLWIYGDSVGDLFYKSISKRALCHEVFGNCNHTYNWVYALKNMNITQAKAEWDTKDFSIDRIISELDDVMSSSQMNDRSVIIINMGLHYVQGVNFTSFRKLIDRTIDLIESHKNSPNGFHGKVIWKTTTALFKERYGDPKTGARHAKGIRFLTVQRVQLFNAYATSSMCNHGIDVLDVYPMSDSFPEGTGGVKKPWDAVHFRPNTFKPVEDLLDEYLG